MKRTSSLLALVIFLITALASAQAAYGHDRHRGNGRSVDDLVFVQTNELDGNHVVVFGRGDDGSLDRRGTCVTGGRGGAAAPGTESDRLASRGRSLVYDEAHRLLFAVNAGSDSVSVFRVRGDRLGLADVDPSGGDFSASIAVFDDLVYVLNAGTTAGCRDSASTATTCTACEARLAHSVSLTPTHVTSSCRPARSASRLTDGSSS